MSVQLVGAGMTDNFYCAFEEKFRGSRDLVKSRLRVYLPFITPLLDEGVGGGAIDLGCGRGEWLELMREIDLGAYGVDLDRNMVNLCLALGLNASNKDAITFLSELPGESQLVVSAFQLVEHLDFNSTQVLVAEALRVLKPGGLLILETPNPENIAVATHNFYLDPTHIRPIPPHLLAFIPEFSGFSRVKTIRLQESEGISLKMSLTLCDVLEGASQDYAVLAQKGGTAPNPIQFDSSFDAEYGIDSATLASHYHLQQQRKFQQTESQVQQIEAIAQRAEAQAQRAEAQAQRAEDALLSLYNSRSWRITASLRWCGKAMRDYGVFKIIKAIYRCGPSFLQRLTMRTLTLIDNNPRCKKCIVRLAQKCGMHNFIELVRGMKWKILNKYTGHPPNDCTLTSQILLSRNAQQIYLNIKETIRGVRR